MHQRILQATVELNTALRNWRRVEAEAKREKTQIPNHIHDKHQAEIGLCKRNLRAAEISAAAMNRFPPLVLR